MQTKSALENRKLRLQSFLIWWMKPFEVVRNRLNVICSHLEWSFGRLSADQIHYSGTLSLFSLFSVSLVTLQSLVGLRLSALESKIIQKPSKRIHWQRVAYQLNGSIMANCQRITRKTVGTQTNGLTKLTQLLFNFFLTSFNFLKFSSLCCNKTHC